MEYKEMIDRALKGRSINSMAKVWGVQQVTLNRYVKGERMPDYSTGLKIAREAGINPAEAFEIFAAEEQSHKLKNFKLVMGFAQPAFLAMLAAITVVVTLFLTPEKAEARTYSPTLTQTTQPIYIMSNSILKVCGLLRAISAWLKRAFSPTAFAPTTS